MQKERAMRDAAGPDRSVYVQPGVAALKRMHIDSSAHLLPMQLSCVQYPFGCDVSQRRSPCDEQSVEMVHLSPMFGLHASAMAATLATTAPATARRAPTTAMRTALEKAYDKELVIAPLAV